MKTRLALVVGCFLVSLLAGLFLPWLTRSASERQPEAGQLLIGFSMDTLKEARWQRDREIFVAKAESLGAKVLVQSANSDDTRQMQDVQSLISNNVDVLVIVPHNGNAMAKAVHLAHEAGVPVIAYDRIINDCDLDLYICFDNVRVGEMQARFLVDSLPKSRRARVMRILGAKTDHSAHLFKQGQDNILNTLVEAGALQIIHEDWAANWKPESAKEITNAALTQYGSNIDAILASNDGTAGGAIQALLEEGLAGKIFVTGQDADLVACQRIVAGTQTMTIYKPIPRLAMAAAELAVKMGRKEPIIARAAINNNKIEVPSILLEIVTVTKHNLDATVIADGFHSRAEVYRNTLETTSP